MSDERRHAEEVADAIISHDDGDTNQGRWRARVADLIQRERADLLSRAEAAEAEAEIGKGATRWYDRISAVVAERDDLRAKLAAAEARVAEFDRTMPDAKATRSIFDAATEMIASGLHVLCVPPKWAADIVAAFVPLVARAEKAEAAAGQMRAALEHVGGLLLTLSATRDAMLKVVKAALATDAGRDYQSPEQVAQACAAARDAALNAAADYVVEVATEESWKGDLLAAGIRALKGGTP